MNDASRPNLKFQFQFSIINWKIASHSESYFKFWNIEIMDEIKLVWYIFFFIFEARYLSTRFSFLSLYLFLSCKSDRFFLSKFNFNVGVSLRFPCVSFKVFLRGRQEFSDAWCLGSEPISSFTVSFSCVFIGFVIVSIQSGIQRQRSSGVFGIFGSLCTFKLQCQLQMCNDVAKDFFGQSFWVILVVKRIQCYQSFWKSFDLWLNDWH